MARLAHLPQYKEKSAMVKDIPTGLYTYPILQVADCLIYKWVQYSWCPTCESHRNKISILSILCRATHVPCGDDQRQQLQLAQHLAKIFNTKFGATFPIIETIIADDPSARIKSLRDPTKKQSKSDPDSKGRLTLRDKPDELFVKIKRALTDFTSEVTYEPEKRPGVANLVTIHALTTNSTPAEICERAKGLDTGQWVFLLHLRLLPGADCRRKFSIFIDTFLWQVQIGGGWRCHQTFWSDSSENRRLSWKSWLFGANIKKRASHCERTSRNYVARSETACRHQYFVMTFSSERKIINRTENSNCPSLTFFLSIRHCAEARHDTQPYWSSATLDCLSIACTQWCQYVGVCTFLHFANVTFSFDFCVYSRLLGAHIRITKCVCIADKARIRGTPWVCVCVCRWEWKIRLSFVVRAQCMCAVVLSFCCCSVSSNTQSTEKTYKKKY